MTGVRMAFASVAALALFAGATAQLGNAQLGGAQLGGMDGPAKPRALVLYAAEPQTVPAGKRAVLEMRFQVVSGFHVNSHRPNSQLLIPTALTLQPTAGVHASALVYPPGSLYSFSFDPGDKVDVYAGSFTVKLPVVATAGEHVLDGTLKYQACDNASCYPPRLLPIKVVFTAQ